MKIAICNEEKLICGQLEKNIRQLLGECSMDCYENGDALLLAETEYDLVFLGIREDGENGENGLKTARALRNRSKKVLLVFITEKKDFVCEAFDVEAFHYLLKPLNEEKLKEVLRRAARHVEESRAKEGRRLLVKTRSRNAAIPISEISYIENQKRKAVIHSSQGVFELYATMKELQEQLDETFFRCHRGYLVNLSYIREYRSDCIFLQNGETVYLAKERYPEFVRTYMEYLQSGGLV